MTPRQIDRFFRILASELDRPASVILTGAAAGSVWGHVRPSLDVDFAIRLPARRNRRDWQRVATAVERTTRLTAIQANYAEDIDRWGAISLMDYRRRAIPYRRFGKLDVRLLDPATWSIGKLTRYLDPDVHDLIAVLKRQRVPMARLVRVWGKALRASPPSTTCTQFRKQTEHFLYTYGRTIWGRGFNPTQAIQQFRREARID